LVLLKAPRLGGKGAEHMKIVGCDLHTRYQQVAMLDQETGELVERRLEHERLGWLAHLFRLDSC